MEIEKVRTENLRKLKEKLGYKKLVAITGKSLSQLSQWVNNSVLSQSGKRLYISPISCRYLEKSLGLPDRWMDEIHDDFIEDTSTDLVPINPDLDDNVRIAVLDVYASAGKGFINPDYPEINRYIELKRDWIERNVRIPKEYLVCFFARGDSMIPTIDDTDILFIDSRYKTFDVDGIYAFAFNDELRVKRIQKKLDGRIAVISDNKAYDTDYIDSSNADAINVVGKVSNRVRITEIK